MNSATPAWTVLVDVLRWLPVAAPFRTEDDGGSHESVRSSSPFLDALTMHFSGALWLYLLLYFPGVLDMERFGAVYSFATLAALPRRFSSGSCTCGSIAG